MSAARQEGHLARQILYLAVVMLSAVWCAGSASGEDDMVRHDWHFRESLRAIRDWETILARWEERTP